MEALKSLESEAVALIVHSQLKSGFAAGGDLYEMYARLRAAGQGRGLEELRQIVERGHRVLNAIDTTPLVAIAAVHGVCFGGAFEYSASAPIPVVVPNTASPGAHAATSLPICSTTPENS